MLRYTISWGKRCLTVYSVPLMLLCLFWPVASRAAMAKNISASMMTTIQGTTSHAKVFVKGDKVRIQVLGGRQFSTMIARYDQNCLYLMHPGARQYKKMTVEAMDRRVPHFFNPDLQIDRRKVAEDSSNGRAAVKYEAKITAPGGMTYQGYLWELVDLPGFPVRWEDPRQGIVVEWQDIVTSELDEAIFAIPADYRAIPAVPPRPARLQRQQARQEKSEDD